ncbi:hypothetical protein V1511DRAFT_493140 [Dipodascopsis uninucleata]
MSVYASGLQHRQLTNSKPYPPPITLEHSSTSKDHNGPTFEDPVAPKETNTGISTQNNDKKCTAEPIPEYTETCSLGENSTLRSRERDSVRSKKMSLSSSSTMIDNISKRTGATPRERLHINTNTDTSSKFKEHHDHIRGSSIPHRSPNTFSAMPAASSGSASTTESALWSKTKIDSGAEEAPWMLQPASSTWTWLPLVFAISPAFSGILFNNGSKTMTDILLLTVMTCYLHWLVKVPHEWYFNIRASVDAANSAVRIGKLGNSKSDIISSDGRTTTNDPIYHETSISQDDTEKRQTQDAIERRREESARVLANWELLALISCFAGPVIGGIMLHYFREIMVVSGTGLVSDFNITLFVATACLRGVLLVIEFVRRRITHEHSLAQEPSKSRVDGLDRRLIHLEDWSRRAEQNVVAIRGIQAELSAKTSALRKERKSMATTDPQILCEIETMMKNARAHEKNEAMLISDINFRIGELEQAIRSIMLSSKAHNTNSSDLTVKMNTPEPPATSPAREPVANKILGQNSPSSVITSRSEYKILQSSGVKNNGNLTQDLSNIRLSSALPSNSAIFSPLSLMSKSAKLLHLRKQRRPLRHKYRIKRRIKKRMRGILPGWLIIWIKRIVYILRSGHYITVFVVKTLLSVILSPVQDGPHLSTSISSL